jgi:hypothetical protein
MQLFKFPNSILKTWQNDLKAFICKAAKIRANVPQHFIFLDRKFGGISLMDPFDLQAQRFIASFLRYFFNSENPMAFNMALAYIQHELENNNLTLQEDQLISTKVINPNINQGLFPSQWILSLAPTETCFKIITPQNSITKDEICNQYVCQNLPRQMNFTDGGITDNLNIAAIYQTYASSSNARFLLHSAYADAFSKEACGLILAKARNPRLPTIVTDSQNCIDIKEKCKDPYKTKHPWIAQALLDTLHSTTLICLVGGWVILFLGLKRKSVN